MQIHRSAHDRAYTVVSNAVLQDHQLSFVARGVLGYLLSLRDETPVDVRSLAKLCATGRDQIAGALNELKARGYYAVERAQDAVTGRWVTRTVVREDPAVAWHGAGAAEPQVRPKAGIPAFGPPDAGEPGGPPERESTGDGVPPSPGQTRLTRHDAALVRRLGQADPRLRMGEAEAEALVPLFARWRERGVPDSALVHVLTAGLPPKVFAPARFVAARLERKLPPQSVRDAPQRAECPGCARPLPVRARGQCRSCRAAEPTGDVSPWAEVARDGRARVRAALAAAAGAAVTGQPAPAPS
jgi:hypothetical protein